MSDIERADKIVGHKQTALHSFEGSRERLGAYLTWLAAQPHDDVAQHAKVTTMPALLTLTSEVRLADIICAIDDARKPKGDGLPPGPWRAIDYSHTQPESRVLDANGGVVAYCHSSDSHTEVAAHIARCGLQSVRDILAACDDKELARWAKIITAYKVINDDVVCTMKGDGMCSWSAITFSARPR